MPRDYKNAKRKPEKKPVPGWVWLLTGLMIGLLVALLVYLGQQPGSSTPSKRDVQVIKKESSKKTSKPESKKDSGVQYEFYTVLPKSEVVIPDQEIIKREKQSEAGKPKYKYLLQAGSFRKRDEAESLKARLALLGVESNVQKVEVNGDDWHRVRIGPLASIREINGIRNRLLNNDVSAILIRIR